jgi:hypothetical protein
VEEDHWIAIPLVEVGEAQAADVAVAGLEAEIGEAFEPLLGSAEGIGAHRVASLFAALRAANVRHLTPPPPLLPSFR